MPNLNAIFILLFGALIIGLLLFIPMRWLAMRKSPPREQLPKVKKGQYLQAIAVVSGLLVVVWFMESGSKVASIVFVAIMLISTVWGGMIVRKAKRKKEDSQP